MNSEVICRDNLRGLNMKFRSLIVTVLVLLVILTAGAVSAADNATSDAIGDETDETGIAAGDGSLGAVKVENHTFEGIMNHLQDSELELEGDYVGNGGEIYLSGNINITGVNGVATLDARNSSRIITNYGNVNLRNIEFVNGANSTDGGAICNYGNLTVADCIFKNNNASDEYHGGAIYNHGNLTVIGCSFMSNYARTGGAIFNDGTLTVIDSSFTSNDARFSGAAIYARSDFAVFNSSFKDNYYGSNDLIEAHDCSVSIDNTTIADNKCVGYEYAAVRCESCNVNINRSRIANSISMYKSEVGIYNSYFDSDIIGMKKGMGISGKVVNNTFKNRHVEVSGSAILLNNIFENSTVETVLSNVSVINSSFENYDKYVFFIRSNSTSIVNCDFKNLTLAIKLFNKVGYECDLKVINSTFENVLKGIDDDIYYYRSSDRYNDNARIINCRFHNMTDAVKLSGNNITISDCEFSDIKNRALLVRGNDQLIDGCSFDNVREGIRCEGYSVIDDGGWFTSANNVRIANVVFNNTIRSVSTNASNLTVADSIFEFNGWSCISNRGVSSNIINCSFSNSIGLAISLRDDTCKAVNIIDNCRFINNKDVYGCIVDVDLCEITTINDSIFINNTVESGTVNAVQPLPHVLINNSIFINNTAKECAGAIYSCSITEILNCIFQQNKAEHGSSIAVANFPKSVIRNCSFINNTSPDRDVLGYFEFKVTQTGFYYGDVVLKVNYIDRLTGEPMEIGDLTLYGEEPFKDYFTDLDEFKSIIYTVYKTSKNGALTLKLSSLKVGTRMFELYGSYGIDGVWFKVVVKKATPKLTAKAKTFKRSDKNKKYTVTLKNKQNKVIKNTKVTITVNKKTYSAKTNSKGIATFKLTKLTKKGKYIATVKFAGSQYYNAQTVKPKITVK